MYKKNVSAETKQLLILILIMSYPQQGVNMISSSQCYSQTMEECEHTAAMLVKVARVENTDHADLMRLKQDVMALSVGYEVEVTTVQSSPAGGQCVLQLAVLRPDTGQGEVRVHHRHAVPGGQGGDHCLSRVCVAQADFYYSSFVKEVLYLILGT